MFPYTYLDNANKLNENALPPIAEFFDTLSNSLRVSDADYARVQAAWHQFGCRNIRDYLLRYLELDCVLLADVFENFRKTMTDNFSLDLSKFVTLPQLTSLLHS